MARSGGFLATVFFRPPGHDPLAFVLVLGSTGMTSQTDMILITIE